MAAFVLAVEGAWADAQQPGHLLRGGEMLTTRTSLRAADRRNPGRIRVAVSHGAVLSNCVIDQAAREVCASRLEIPTTTVNVGLTVRLRRVVERLLGEDEQRYVSALARGGSELQPGLALLSAEALDLSLVFRARLDRQAIRPIVLRPIGRDDLTGVTLRIAAGWTSITSVPTLRPGLFAAQLDGDDNEVSVLVTDDAKLVAEFAHVLQVTQHWGPERQRFLAAYVDEVASGTLE